MLRRQIFKFLEPGVTSVVQHNKMGTIFKVITKEQTPRCCDMLWTQLPAVQQSFISILQTQMLVVPLTRYPGLCVKTWFVFATGDNHRVIGLTFSPIASALVSVKLAALPAFYADIC